MTWYAPPEPSWDVCWDFKKAYAPQKGGKGSGKGGKSWKSWGWEEQSYAPPPWWGGGYQAQAPMPYGAQMMMPPWMMQGAPVGGPVARTPLTLPQQKGQNKEEPVLPAFLEKRFAERRGASNQQQYNPETFVQPPPEKEYEGSLKSISAKHGYGFIVCDETNRIYGRDVYLPKDAVPEGVKALDRLRFSLALSAKGHPQARNVTVTFIAPVEESKESKEAEEADESKRPEA